MTVGVHGMLSGGEELTGVDLTPLVTVYKKNDPFLLSYIGKSFSHTKEAAGGRHL